MNDDIQIITAVIAKAPMWIRQDLASPEAATRLRAEETLAAMIKAALSVHVRPQDLMEGPCE